MHLQTSRCHALVHPNLLSSTGHSYNILSTTRDHRFFFFINLEASMPSHVLRPITSASSARNAWAAEMKPQSLCSGA